MNRQLDKMGYNIGLRLIEDFLARTNTGKCGNFRETAETIAKVGGRDRILGTLGSSAPCQIMSLVWIIHNGNADRRLAG